MKSALYFDEGRSQIVLTPETKMDKLVLDNLRSNLGKISVHSGDFYQCAGGWTRHSGDNDSTFIVLDKSEKSNENIPIPPSIHL